MQLFTVCSNGLRVTLATLIVFGAEIAYAGPEEHLPDELEPPQRTERTERQIVVSSPSPSNTNTTNGVDWDSPGDIQKFLSCVRRNHGVILPTSR